MAGNHRIPAGIIRHHQDSMTHNKETNQSQPTPAARANQNAMSEIQRYSYNANIKFHEDKDGQWVYFADHETDTAQKVEQAIAKYKDAVKLLSDELNNIINAEPWTWDYESEAEQMLQFRAWAVSRAKFTLSKVEEDRAEEPKNEWVFHPSTDVGGKAMPEYWENEATGGVSYVDPDECSKLEKDLL